MYMDRLMVTGVGSGTFCKSIIKSVVSHHRGGQRLFMIATDGRCICLLTRETTYLRWVLLSVGVWADFVSLLYMHCIHALLNAPEHTKQKSVVGQWLTNEYMLCSILSGLGLEFLDTITNNLIEMLS